MYTKTKTLVSIANTSTFRALDENKTAVTRRDIDSDYTGKDIIPTGAKVFPQIRGQSTSRCQANTYNYTSGNLEYVDGRHMDK